MTETQQVPVQIPVEQLARWEQALDHLISQLVDNSRIEEAAFFRSLRSEMWAYLPSEEEG